jgi:hypothetical protein
MLGLVGPVAVITGSLVSGQTDGAAKYRRLGAWLLLAWILGLLVSTPAYTPYPRLVLPWLVAIWLGASAQIGLLAKRPAAAESPEQPQQKLNWRPFLVPGAVWVCGLVLWAFVGRGARSAFAEAAWQDRAARERVVLQAADIAARSAGGTPPKSPLFLTYGEPAIFFHLKAHHYDAQVVGAFDFLAPGKFQATQPAFVLAYETPELKKLLAPYQDRLTLMTIFDDTPSDIVLLDSHAPADIATVATRPREALRLYRINGS